LHTADSTEFFDFGDTSEISLVDEIQKHHDDFVKRLQVPAKMECNQTDQELLAPDDSLQELLTRHRKLQANIKLLEMECAFIDTQIKQRIGGHAGYTLPGRTRPLVSWKETTINRFDQKAFKEAHENLFKQFVKPSVSRRFTVHD
jgi:predicted phage-related endonuclease